MIDDPATVSLLAPLSVRLSPKRMRYGICSEEYCFEDPKVGAFFSLGNAVPVQRGASIHQFGMSELARHVDAGDWVHVFAEGRIWQEGGLPLRDEEGRWCLSPERCSPPGVKLGPLKWGIGKLIANSAVVPAVVPFFHLGLERIVPQDGANNVLPGAPHFGKDVTIKVGDPVYVADLVEAYHAAAEARAAARDKARTARGEPRSTGAIPQPAQAPEALALARKGAAKEGAAAAQPVQTQLAEMDHQGAALDEADEPAVRAAMAHAAVAASLPAATTPNAWTWQTAERVIDSAGRTTFPSRVTADGRVVPAHIEEPLRIRPRDHFQLKPDEAAAEEGHRLALYKAITDRVYQSLLALEKQVRAHRLAKGVTELEQR